MLTPRDVDGNLFVDGRVEVGDKYPSICCQGYEWEVVYIFRDMNSVYDSIWGSCHNTDCPVEVDNHYHGISSYLAEDLALKLLEVATT